jgi:hypothetical protein
MRGNMIFFITNTPNSVPSQESETIMTEVRHIPLSRDTRFRNLLKEAQQAGQRIEHLVELKDDSLMPTPELEYHWGQTQRFLVDVLHMKDANIFPVAHWAWLTSLWIKGAKDDWARQLHELSGVLVAPDGSIVGYTTCVPTSRASGAEWGKSVLRLDTCTDYGLDVNKPVPVGNGYWFAHPAIMHGQQVAHVRYVSVGMG